RTADPIPEQWSNDSASHVETAELDPLIALGGSIAVRPRTPEPSVNLQPDSPLRDPYSPPPPRMPTPPEPARRSSGRLPDGWDRPGRRDPSARVAPEQGKRGGVPTDWDRPVVPSPRAASARVVPAPKPPPSSVIPSPAPPARGPVQSVPPPP